jgi:hypothetical protein
MLNNPADRTDPIERLRKATEALARDATRVELLAAILSGWAKPVPDYRPDDRHRIKSARSGSGMAAESGNSRGSPGGHRLS